MPTIDKLGYDAKTLKKFVAFSKRTLMQDVRNAFLAADLKVKITIDSKLLEHEGNLIVVVSALQRAPSYGLDFLLSFNVSGTTIQHFKYYGPSNVAPVFENRVLIGSDRVTVDDIVGTIYKNSNTRHNDMRAWSDRANRIESFDNRVADAVIVFADSVQQLIAEFERVQ